jgi:plasmid maintenance system antidote protein VapI
MRHYTEGEIIKALRDKFTPRQGQTQTQVAATLGFSTSYIQAVLAGARPLTRQMAEVLGFHEAPRQFTRKVQP